MPNFPTLAQEMTPIDADAILAALKFAKRSLGAEFEKDLLKMYHDLENDVPYGIDEKQVSVQFIGTKFSNE